MTTAKSTTSVASPTPTSSKTAVSTSSSASASNARSSALTASNSPQVINRADVNKSSMQPGNAGGPTDGGNYVNTSPTGQ